MQHQPTAPGRSFLLKDINAQATHTMLSFTALMAANAIDMVFIAHLGHQELTAASLASPFMWFMNTIAMGVALAISVYASKETKKTNSNTITEVLLPGLIIGLLVYIATLLGVGLNLESLVGVMGAGKSISVQSENYLEVWLYSFIITTSFAISTAYLRGLSLFKTQAIVVAIVCLGNVILDPLLMFGIYKFEGLGLVGSVYAACIAQGIGAIICIYYGIKNTQINGTHRLSIINLLRDSLKISKLAWVTSSTATFWPISGLASTYLISALGDAEIATMGVISKLQPLMMIPIWGISAVTTVFLSRAFANYQYNQIRPIFTSGFTLILVWQTVVALPFIIFSYPIANFMLDGYVEAVPYVVLYLMIIPISVFGRGMLYLTVHGLPAIEKAKTAMTVDSVYVLILHTGCYGIGYLLNDFNLSLKMLLVLNLTGAACAIFIVKRTQHSFYTHKASHRHLDII